MTGPVNRVRPPDAHVSIVSTDDIFRELGGYWRSTEECGDLLQFRRMVTARQYQRFYQLLTSTVPRGASVLDWGCGNGHASYGMQRLGYRVHGYSFQDFPLRRHLGAEYRFSPGHVDDPCRLPFEAGSFDAVTSVGVLEHVRETGGDEASSLLEVRRVLRPGGVFLCYHFPNRYSLIEAMNRRVPSQHAHRYRYSRRDIHALVEGAGMELEIVRRYAALPRNFWHRLPRALGDSALVGRVWEAADRVLGFALSPLVQNYLFIARKPGMMADRPGREAP